MPSSETLRAGSEYNTSASGSPQSKSKMDMRNDHFARALHNIGTHVTRYGLALVIFWIGCLKFTAYEAKGVFAHASNSPLLSWAYQILDIRGFNRALGVVEIGIALMIVTRSLWPKLSALGSLGAIATFLTTLSFLLTSPGVWQPEYGLPFLSGAPGQFLVKDLVMLGAAIWTAGEALLASSERTGPATERQSASGGHIAPDALLSSDQRLGD